MAYVSPNFKTKKALKEAVASGKKVRVFQPGGLFPDPTYPGTASVEGPNYKPHTWYASVVMDEQGYVVKVK